MTINERKRNGNRPRFWCVHRVDINMKQKRNGSDRIDWELNGTEWNRTDTEGKGNANGMETEQETSFARRSLLNWSLLCSNFPYLLPDCSIQSQDEMK